METSTVQTDAETHVLDSDLLNNALRQDRHLCQTV